MSKIAILVSFTATTRLIIDTDDIDRDINSDEGVTAICEAAREKMCREPENYLYSDNLSLLEKDIEVPARENEPVDVKLTK